MQIIGERVNATRKIPRQALRDRDREAIVAEIRMQDEAGAHYIDLNAGSGDGDSTQEGEDLCWLVDVALDCTEKKLALDASDPAVIAVAAEHLGDRREWLYNSVKNDPKILDAALPVVAAHGVDVVALAMDSDSIPQTVERRVACCVEVAEAAAKAGIGAERILFDPLVFPLSADISQGLITLDTLHRVKAEIPGCRSTMGASNISYGLPKRARINQAFLIAAISQGLDSAICDPSRPSIKQAILLGELISGGDRHCRRYNRAVKKGIFS